MPHGAALTEAEELEILAAETGQLPPEGFSSQIVRAHFLGLRGIAITPAEILRRVELENLAEVQRTETELPAFISEETIFGPLEPAELFRPGGALFDIVPRVGGTVSGVIPTGQQEAAFDIFTTAHVAVGLALAIAKVPRPFAYAAIIGTEIVEILLRRRGIFRDFFTESPENVAVDVLASAAGFEIGRLLPRG